jgi:hypothetical protein
MKITPPYGGVILLEKNKLWRSDLVSPAVVLLASGSATAAISYSDADK